MAKTVVGLFDSFTEARNAVQDLVDMGIAREQISLVANDARGEYGDANQSGEASAAAEGAGAGAVGGTLAGGALGLLIGAGLLVIPGIGPVLAAGPLAAAIGTAAATVGATALGAGIGAATGGLLGGLIGSGVPEEEAQTYAEGVRRGGTLVSVSADDSAAEQVRDALLRRGAIDIDRRGAEWRAGGWEGGSLRSPDLNDTNDSPREDWQESSKVGTGAGVAAGAATGAAIGAAGGPVGAVIGGAAGALTGAAAGAAGDVAGERTEDNADAYGDRRPASSTTRSDVGDTPREDWHESSKVGTGAGTAAGAATGAAIGAAGGPVGAVIGGAAGALSGAAAGAAGDVAGERTEDATRGGRVYGDSATDTPSSGTVGMAGAANPAYDRTATGDDFTRPRSDMSRDDDFTRPSTTGSGSDEMIEGSDFARGQRQGDMSSGQPDFARGQDSGVSTTHSDFARGQHGGEPTGHPDYARGQRQFADYDSDFRTHYQSSFAAGGRSYEDYAPGYRFGHDLAGDATYTGSDWGSVEYSARDRWERDNPNTWEQMKDSIRYAWEKARGLR